MAVLVAAAVAAAVTSTAVTVLSHPARFLVDIILRGLVCWYVRQLPGQRCLGAGMLGPRRSHGRVTTSRIGGSS